MEKKSSIFSYIAKSKFIRSIFFRVLFIFIALIFLIVLIVFISFSSEINKSVISSKEKQLEVITNDLSGRVQEASNIAHNISNDSLFILNTGTDKDITNTLNRYMSGNAFIKHLVFYRTGENGKIYTSDGVKQFDSFFESHLLYTDESLSSYSNNSLSGYEKYINLIESKNTNTLLFLESSNNSNSYLSYICPLTLLADKPDAYTIMYIPYSEIDEILETQLNDCYGSVSIYDTNKNMLYQKASPDFEMDIDANAYESGKKFSYDGDRYIIQKKISTFNGSEYVSIVRLNDMVSKLFLRQALLIVALVVVTILALFIVLRTIVKKYRPINNLAQSFSENGDGVIDEKNLLETSITSLKSDSEQKQKFETAYHEADAANKAKSVFLSKMSHDIRTPMNAIIGMTQIAEKHIGDETYVKECLKKVQDASDYLLDIINNILDMSRIESGSFNLNEEKTSIPKIIYSIISIINQSIDAKKIKLDVEATNVNNELVLCDSVRLTQVFMNIMSNAIKFTQKGGKISVGIEQKASSDEKYGDYIFTFTDNGIGMSKEFVNKVFDTFARDEKANIKKIEGTGLGMAIAKNLVELMGGKISCESELGVGTTFTINLHLRLMDEIEPFDCEKYSNMPVLIIGEQEKVCQNQTELFRQFNVETDFALTPDEAIELAKSNSTPYKIVLINQAQSDKSGIETVKRISDSLILPNVKYILVSYDFVGIDQSGAANAGMSGFVRVPLFKSTIKGILDGTITTQKNRRISHADINLENYRVLIVEDNDINREIAHRIISETKINIVEATNGKEAVELFKNNPENYFDVILMDLQMPIMNGYEATYSIRNMNKGDSLTIPIFALTANTFDEDVRQVRESGMNGHIGKPYVPDELISILNQIINKK